MKIWGEVSMGGADTSPTSLISSLVENRYAGVSPHHPLAEIIA
jgi:hypothetical protein